MPLPELGPLSTDEQRLWNSFPTGGVVDLRAPAATGAATSALPVVRVAVIRALLLGAGPDLLKGTKEFLVRQKFIRTDFPSARGTGGIILIGAGTG